MTQQPSHDWLPWGVEPPCTAHGEAIADLRVQMAHKEERDARLEGKVDTICQTLNNGLKDEVQRLTEVVMGDEEHEGLAAKIDRLYGALHDAAKIAHYTRLVFYWTLKALAALIPIGGSIWVILKYVLGVI